MSKDHASSFPGRSCRTLMFSVLVLCSSIFLGIIFPSPAQAITIDTPIFLPHEQTLVTGKGEPNARISITGYSATTKLFSLKTTVNRQGTWQVTLPPQDTQPDTVEVLSEVSLTPMKVLESVTVFGTVALSGIVLIQQFFERALRLLQVLGLFPKRTVKGYIFDAATKKPISFALLSVENVQDKELGAQAYTIRETVVSTVDGIFRTITLPSGKYRIQVTHPQYTFPCIEKRPWYTSPLDFYQGEIIELSSQRRLDIVFIPMRHKSAKVTVSLHWFNIKVLTNMIHQVLSALAIPLGVASLILALLYPSFINFALASMYIALCVYELLKRQQLSRLSGSIVSENNRPVADAVVQIIESHTEEVASVVVSKKSGKYSILLPKAKYHLNVAKNGYAPDRKEVMSFDEIDLTRGAKKVTTQLLRAGG